MTHWLVRYTRRGMEPPRPFGKTKTVVCADTRDEAKARVNAASGYPITASKTDDAVSFLEHCSCPTWHVVTSQGSMILGVFGESLLADAQECAAKIERQTCFPAFVSQVTGRRPSVGEVLP